MMRAVFKGKQGKRQRESDMSEQGSSLGTEGKHLTTVWGNPKSVGETAGADRSRVGPAVTPQPLQSTSPLTSQHFPSPFNLVFELLSRGWLNTRDGAPSPLSLHPDLDKVAFVSKCPFPFAHRYFLQHPPLFMWKALFFTCLFMY